MQTVTKTTVTSCDSVDTTVDELRTLSIRSLARMYLPDQRLFVHCLRRRGLKNVPEGVSRRYTAITLIGLATQEDSVVREVLGGGDAKGLCARLLDDVHTVSSIGDVALTLWAASMLRHENAGRARDRMMELDPCHGSHPTVELAWCVTALSIEPGFCGVDEKSAAAVAQRLMASFAPTAGLFPHWPVGARSAALRAHIACFADLVYPIQALAHYHARTGNDEAMNIARQCAQHTCSLQGEHGQWWWHYDARTGRVVEPFPVYSVHQDAMAPMALFALQDAGGGDYREAIDRGLKWLRSPSEVSVSLIDSSAGVIWRKVARCEPGKLSRGAQALASRVHPSFRVPGLDVIFRPSSVDYECRPYHLGWLLYAWSKGRAVA